MTSTASAKPKAPKVVFHARDLLHLHGQMITIALVVSCGIAAFVAMRSNYFLKMALAAVRCGVALGVGAGAYLGAQLIKVYAEFFRFPVYHYEMRRDCR